MQVSNNQSKKPRSTSVRNSLNQRIKRTSTIESKVVRKCVAFGASEKVSESSPYKRPRFMQSVACARVDESDLIEKIHSKRKQAQAKRDLRAKSKKRVTFAPIESENSLSPERTNQMRQSVREVQSWANFEAEKSIFNENATIKKQKVKAKFTYKQAELFEDDEECRVAFDSDLNEIVAKSNPNRLKKRSRNSMKTNANLERKPAKKLARDKRPQKKQAQSALNQRAETECDQGLQTDKQVKDFLRKNLVNVMQSQNLPSSCYVVEELKKELSSPHFKKVLEKRRLKELAKLNDKYIPYSEIIYDKQQHHKKLNGIIARQYDPSFFLDEKTDEFDRIFESIKKYCFNEFTEKANKKLINRLKSGVNQLLILYDTRKPKDIPNSRNRQSVIESQKTHCEKMIGFAIYQETHSLQNPCIFVHKLLARRRKRGYKQKLILALKVAQQHFRAHEILIQIKDRDEDKYHKQGFFLSKKTKDDLSKFGIDSDKGKKIMSFETLLKDRDMKQNTYMQNAETWSLKGKNLEANIAKLREWLKINHELLETIIRKKVRSKAVITDQARTPQWLFDSIKKFAHLTDKEILDVFVYQENWCSRAFYDGYKKPWDPKVFTYINSPFTQIVAALKKSAEFQTNGGNCAMILPTISLEKSELYKQCLSKTTIRIDLPLFAFDGFKNPLMKHIVLLYFLQPDFTNQVILKNNPKPLETVELENDDETRLRITHLLKKKKCGRKKNDLREVEKNEILELYQAGKGITYIHQKLKRRYQTVRQSLNDDMGYDQVEAELLSRLKLQKSDIKGQHFKQKEN